MAKTAPSGTLGSMPVRCLIVDDNHDFLRAARDLLERQGITVVGLASTGAQAYRGISELKPDVVLIDIDLGEESGFQVASELGTRLNAEQPTLVLISAYAADDLQDMIADTPAVSFLPKSDLSGMAIRGILGQRDSR
jgi:CheY-like chemotaxis protein